jgi:sodium transport system permease protein
MNAWLTVWRKEIVEALRDRRTVFNALLLGPLLMPMLMLGLGALAASKQQEKIEKPLELPVAGGEHAPNLVEWLKGQGVRVQAPPADIDAAIRRQDQEVVLVLDADYARDWRQSLPARIEIVHDSSRVLETRATLQRVENLLERYDRQVGALRLVARGVHPSVGAPLAIAHRDLATPQGRASLGLMSLPYLLIFLGFIGGAYLAIDATAGERERQSLEPLLATAAARAAIMSGKLAAAVAFALASLSLTLLAFWLSSRVFGSERIGMRLDLSPASMGLLFLALMPTVVLGAALLTMLAAFAKSYKEAQSYFGILMLVPMIPTLVLMVSPVKTQLWMYAVPFLGPNQLLLRLLRAEPIRALEWGVFLGAGVGIALVVWIVTAGLYRREQLAISA